MCSDGEGRLLWSSQREMTLLCKVCPVFQSLMVTAVLYSMDTCSLQLSAYSGKSKYSFPHHHSADSKQFLTFPGWSKRGKRAVLTPTKHLFPLCHWRNPQVHRHCNLWALILPCFTVFYWAMTVTWSVFHNFDFAVSVLSSSLLLCLFLVNAVSFTLLLSLVCNFVLCSFY